MSNVAIGVASKMPVIGTPVSELAKVTEQDTPLIDELNGALDILGNAIDEGNHTSIRNEAANVLSVLKQIFSSPNSENFKNVGSATRWVSYLAPLKNLFGLLELYLRPGIGTKQPPISRLQQALKPAKDLIKGESTYQQGLLARGTETICDQFGRACKRTIHGYTGSSAPLEDAIKKHPLSEINQLIGTYLTHGEDYLPVSRENNLSAALRRLDQESNSFHGVERFIYGKITEGTLHENLDALVQGISEFIEVNGSEEIYVFLYHKAAENGQVGYWQKKSDQTGQIAWAKEHVKAQGPQGLQKLWVAAAEFDEIEDLRQLEASMKTEVTTPTELSHNIDLALRFFQRNPSRLGKDVLAGVTHVTAGWLSLTYTWMSEHLESSELHALETRLNRLKQQINRGNHFEALSELKEELQRSPLAKKMHEGKDSVSPLNTIQQVKEKQAKTISPKKEVEMASWDAAMQKEKDRLVDQVGYLSTFKTIYNVIGSPATKVDPLEFQKQSDAAYVKIMTAVGEAPLEEQQSVFVTKMKEAIEERQDISFFRKMTAKLTTWVVMHSVRFFTKHFTHSFIDYLTNTLSLPTRQPLSTIHLSPVERVNDCFIAQKKALSRWANDERGEEFGPLGRKKALEIALKNPELNGGYEHDELVDRTTRCAIDQFLSIDGAISGYLFSANRALEDWTNQAQSKAGYVGRLLVSVVPQVVVTEGYLIGKGLEWVGSKVLRFAAKQFMTRCNIANTVLDSMKDSLYKQSQYTNAIDEVLLDQLLQVEKLLEQGGGEAIEHEGEEAKKIFREAVANAVRVIDLNRNLTSESLKDAQTPRDNALSEAIDAGKEFADAQLRDAIVQLLIIIYQSVLTEDQMNALILQIFQKTNDSLFPQTVIQMYYSQEEKDKMAADLGHKPTDAELKAKFAASRSKAVTDVTDAEIQSEMKVRFNKTEQALRETTFRVIKKSVHEVVQEEGKKAFMSAGQSVISYIDFMDRYLFEGTGSSSTNLFVKTKESLKAFESASSEAEAQEILETLNKDTLEFLRDYEKKQQLIDNKVTGQGQTSAHVRRINEISNKEIMPKLLVFQEALQKFIRKKDKGSLEAVRSELDTFNQSVYNHQAELEQIKQEELHLQSNGKTLSEKACIWFGKVLKPGAPIALDQVENYANARLNQIAEGAFHLYKDSNTFESFLRHVVMLNFVESLGYKKGVKA